MKFILSDDELTAYASGTMSEEASRALERKAVETGQTDLLLSVIVAQSGIDKELAIELWGEDSLNDLWHSEQEFRAAAYIDEDVLKK